MSVQLIVLAALPASYAVPQPFLQPRVQQSPAASPTTLSPKIWGPILAISIVLFAIVAWHTTTQPLLHRLFRGIAANSHSNTTELTADQLAGSINRNTSNADSVTETRPRRTRRARRTPSQISTRSLPAYMKEPGEHELVIIRGSADMHDVPQPVATVMPSVDEDGEEAVNRSQSNDYPPLAHSLVDMPFLHGHEPNVTPTSAVGPDPRGETPTYEEAIGVLPLQSPPLFHVSLNDPPSLPASLPSTPELPHFQRRSGLRSLWSAMNPNRLSHASRIHRRNDSDSSSNESPSRTRNTLTYHGSPSVTSIFRPLSRQRSIRTINSNHLTSPSVISINSISAPLTHTAVRTEFTFPRAGPTPEQFKLISSSDALARFGRPYGADAIAFAASTSRQDLDPPPPNFDASSSTAHLLPASRADLHPSESPSPSPRLNIQVPPLVRTQLEDIPQSATQPYDDSAEPDHDDAAIDRNRSTSSKHALSPASFRTPTEFGVRAESSSHSMRSYATALESIATHGMPVDPNENSS
ncbi:hypothetical protein APHAL10511_007251 [Amanita phalloides]|nr:hypothetical protein APHAL10511_007251 [Amanita phalloides]